MFGSFPRRVFALVIGLIVFAMVYVMLGRSSLYPTWTVVMMALVGLGALWYGFRDLAGSL